MAGFAVPEESRRELTLREPETIAGIRFEPFSVIHSTRAPAVGYRISAGRSSVFYVPDVVRIHDRGEALGGARLYIGDGATIHRHMVRREKKSARLIGHATIAEQLTWCRDEAPTRCFDPLPELRKHLKALQTGKGKLSRLLHSQEPRQLAFAAELGRYAAPSVPAQHSEAHRRGLAVAPLLVILRV